MILCFLERGKRRRRGGGREGDFGDMMFGIWWACDDIEINNEAGIVNKDP